MAFFEELGKKVSQTGQDAIKKTKILAETTKLNAKISEEKRAISELYAKIGEKYYELFKAEPDVNLAEFTAGIDAACQRIEEYEDQIKELKGIDTCPGCGAALSEGTLFCSNCGTKLPDAPVEEPKVIEVTVRVCKNCGSELPGTAQFCSGCGQKAE